MIRFGIIGTNRITEQFIEAAREIEDFALTAVYSRTVERAVQFAAKHGAAHTFTDLEQMAQSDKLDAVYIASPTSLHKNHAILFLNNGKHVLCEKPIASNARELNEMITAAKENKVVLMEAMKSTLLPNFAVIQQNLHKLGKLRRYVANYCQYSSRYDAYKEGNIMNAFLPQFSNGAMMDIGVYCIYPAVVLFGAPKSVKAEAFMLESGVDGQGSMILQYEEMDAVLMYSKITNSSLPSEIQGESGHMIIDQISYPSNIHIQYRDGTIENITNQAQSSAIMLYEVKAFIEYIQNGKLESPINSHANSLAVMNVMDEARRQIGLVYPADHIS